jgi:hypothetical protein
MQEVESLVVCMWKEGTDPTTVMVMNTEEISDTLDKIVDQRIDKI